MPNCAKCGANLRVDATECEYCGSVVEVARSSAMDDGFVRGERPAFKKVSIGMMLLLTLCTMGYYPSLWFFFRREGLKKLNPDTAKKTDTLIYACMALQACGIFIVFSKDPDLLEAASTINLCFWGCLIYTAFFIRSLLRNYAVRTAPNSPLPAFIAPSALWTFLFSIFYLQSHINQMLNVRLLEQKY